jgi:CO/xanthine dehydrogenase Mo-binding subunit
MPTGEPGVQWAYGDLSAGFQQAALVLDDTFHTQTTSHQPLETRTAMAYWQNGKLYLHCSTQSVMRTVESVAQWVGIKPEQIVVISEYTGGGFGSKIPGTHTVAVPALLARKIGGPVMMRISREEEHYIGRHRPSLMARVKIGFREDGRVTAVDMFILQDAGPYEDQFDLEAAPMMCSLAYQPMATRFRGLSVLTNTPPPTSQRAPGGAQMNAIMEPLLAKAAHQLKIVAAIDLGGRPDDYRVGGGRVYQQANPARHLTFAQAALRAITLGGKYDGHELPSNIHRTTRASATVLAGLGLMGVAKDVYPHDGETHSYVVGFAEVEVDVETGV